MFNKNTFAAATLTITAAACIYSQYQVKKSSKAKAATGEAFAKQLSSEEQAAIQYMSPKLYYSRLNGQQI